MKPKQNIPGYTYIVVPTVTLLFAAPFALSVVKAPGFDEPIVFLPFWIGILCIPGYVTAWKAARHHHSLSLYQRFLAVGSLAFSIICALGGAIFSLFSVIGAVLSIWSGILTILLLLRVCGIIKPEGQLRKLKQKEDYKIGDSLDCPSCCREISFDPSLGVCSFCNYMIWPGT